MIAINVSKSFAMFFVKAGRRIPKTQPVQLFGDQPNGSIPPVILGANLDARLTWSTHIDQVRTEAAQGLEVL